MLARQYLCKRQLWQASCNYASVRFTQSISKEVNLETINLETRLPMALIKKPQRKPFVKNLFLGSFDKEFLYYPEPQNKDRHTQFFEWLQPIERYISECLKDPQNVKKNEVLSHLRDLGVFRANIDEQHLGLQLNQSELAKVVEVLSSFPWLGSYMVNNHIIPVKIISSVGSAEQKAKYLPGIATGEFVPTICFTDSNNNINLDSINTIVQQTDCKEYWMLNGKKAFITNGQESNLFIVFSVCGYHQFMTSNSNRIFSMFLVERNFGGITCETDNNLIGFQSNSTHTVTFKDTKIPKANLMCDTKYGIQILIDTLAPGNKNIAPQAIGILRNFTKLLQKHILQRKHLDQDLYQFEGVQGVVGKLASTLYSMESVLYMTTGMADLFENQDCTLEKAMVETYCASECIARIYEGLQIIGAPSYLRENPYIQIFEDALSFTLLDTCNLESNMYIALLGLQHCGKHLHQHIFKIRNPMFHPDYILKWLFGRDEQLRLNLAEHMHPSLLFGAALLEKCLAQLQNSTLYMLNNHGKDVNLRQLELHRLSELATRIYVLIAVFSRTSRAYCIGLRNSDMDRQAANSIASLTLNRVKILANEILATQWNNGDKCHKDIANLMYAKKDYFAEHPLNRTY